MGDTHWAAEIEIVPPAKNKLEAAERVLKGEDYGSVYIPSSRRKVDHFSVQGDLKGLVKMFIFGKMMTQFYLGEHGGYYWQSDTGVWIALGDQMTFIVEDQEVGRAKVKIGGTL